MTSLNNSASIRECIKALSDPILAENIKNLMREIIQTNTKGDELNGIENQHR